MSTVEAQSGSAGRRRRGIAISLILTFTVLSLASASGDVSIFGPKRYDRHRGAPTIYRDTFNRCGTVGTALLRVTNGGGPDTRVTSAEIEINGREVARESDFKKKVPSFEKTVSLRESNTLTVKLKSGRHDGDSDDHDGGRQRDEHKGSGGDKDSLSRKSSQKNGGKDEARQARTDKESDKRDDDHERGDYPASFLIIEVVAVGCDTVPPVISIQEPSDGALLNVAAPRIAANYADETGGMGIDPATVRMTVDGTDVTSSSSVSPTGISYAPSSNLSDAIHTVSVSVADKAGNPATLTWSFTTDTKAPVVAITSHQNEQFLNNPILTLSGALDDPSAWVTVNGQNAQVTGNIFSLANFALAEGDNAVTVTATDAAGNSSSSNINIIRDTLLPVINATDPQPNDFVKTSSITVTGTIAELHFAGLWINESPVPVANGSFSQLVALQMEGGNPIVLRAKDLANNETIVTIPVTLDTIPPVVQISAPAMDSFVNLAQASVSGTVNEEVDSVTVNSVPAVVTGSNFSLENITLSEGPNPFLVEAKDKAGNSGTQNVTVTLDTIKPVIQVAFPTKDSFVSMPSITASGSVSDANAAGLWVNNTAVQLENGNFTIAGVPLAEGPNTINIRATDKAGNESVLPVPLTRDTVAPVVTITAPVPNALLGSQQVTVSGTVSELNTMVTVNGSAAQVTGQDFTLTGVALAEGPSDIYVVATDRAGNPGPASVHVKVDTIKPAPPVLRQPLSPVKILQTSITGTAEPGSTVEVSATGPDGLASLIGTLPADAQGGFTIPSITLLEGTTSFTATATDATGNKSDPSAAVLVTLDTAPPVFTVTAPMNNSYISTPTVQVTGSLDDASATLTISGTSVPLNGTSFDHTAMLTSGLNSLVLVATDPAGNPSSATVLVTLDQTLPVVTITSPLSSITVTNPQVLVAGSVNESVTSVTVNSLPALVSGQSFSFAAFTLSEGLNDLTVEAKDRAGNPGSSVVKVTLDSIAPTVSLAAPAQAAAGATVVLSFSAGDTGGLRLAEVNTGNASLWSFSPNAELSTQNSISYTLSPDLAPGSVVNLQGRAYDVAGNMGSAPAQIVITQGPSGPGYIQGEVYDDTRGLLLEGADVLVTAIGREAKHMTTGADGGYYTETAKGDYLITITKPKFTTVERMVTVRPEKTAVALDARLTPISGQQNLVLPSGGAIAMPLPMSSAATGTAGTGVVSQATGTIELIVPSGAVAAQKDIRLTLVSNQGLANPLPRGWSPIAAANVSVQPLVSGEGSELLFSKPAEFRLPVAQGTTMAPLASVALISYDVAFHQWIVRSWGTVSADGVTISASIASTGQYALVLPDDPAQTATEQDVLLLPLPVTAAPEPQQITAAGGVVPPFSLPAVDLRATGELTVTRSEGATIDLVSGLALNARVSERFDLLSGDAVLPTDHVQDLLLYRYPCATNIGAGVVSQGTGSAGSATAVDLETQTAGRVVTTFPVAPSREYTIVQLMMGKVGFTITLPEPDASGSLIGADGGRLLDTDGTVISVPAGALTETVPVRTRTIAPAVASGLVGPDFTLLRAVEVNFTGRILSSSAELSIPVPAGFNAGLPVVIAKAIDVRGVQKLKLVALAYPSGSLITSLTPGPLPLAPGITSSGMFFFLQAKAPLGYVKGTVRDSTGNPAHSAFLTSNTCSLADLTGPAGTYLIASTVSPFGVRAVDISSYNEGLGTGTITAAGQLMAIDLSIAVTPPHVVSILPVDGAVKIEPNTPVEIAFSEPLDKLTITSANITVKNSAGSAVSGAFSVNAEGTVVTFYPAALFASETAYTVSIAGNTLKDLQGNAMSGGFSSGFTIRDTTPPLPPPAGRITATFPDAGGMVTVSATQGTVEGDISVLIINDATGEIVTVLSGTDGSFSARISAQLGDEVKIVMMDAAGNQTLISYITFKSDDGKYLVTAKGGIVDGEGDSRLVIPDGALPGPTVIKLTVVTEAQLPHPVQQPGQFIAALNVDTGGVDFQKEVKLSVPVPAGLTAEAPVFLTQPSVLQNADGTTENVYLAIDSTKIINGRLTTASKPYDGVFTAGIFSFTEFPTIYPAIISGYAYRDMDFNLVYEPKINADGSYDPAYDLPVKNAVIRTSGGFNYITRTKADGFYASFTFVTNDIGQNNAGNCRDYSVTAIHPETMHRVTLPGSVCEPPYNIQRLDFALANKDTVIPDTASPVISLNLRVAPGQTTVPGDNVPPQFVAGTIPVSTDIEVPIEVLDQAINTPTMTVTYKTPDMETGLAYTVPLSQTSVVIYTAVSPSNPAPVYRYNFRPNFSSTTPSNGYGLPIDGSTSVLFRPSAPGTYTLLVEATDTAGHTSTRSVTVRAVLSGSQPAGLDGPPRIDEINPADGANEIMVTMPVKATFSEPVQNVDAATFLLYDHGPASLVSGQTFTPVAVPAAVYTNLEGGRMVATLQPKTNLMFGRKYRAALTAGITDYASSNVDGTIKGLENPMTVTFITKVPQTYDLPAGDQFQPSGASDIALYTAANGRTFAYIASGVSGFRVADVTDPTNPYITYDSTQIEHFTSLTKAYRGVAVDQASGILAVTDLITYTLEGSAQATQSNFNAIGNVRFFDLNDHPDNPGYMIGHDRLTENYSGVPGKLAVSGNYAYVSTAMVGLQVVDIAASKSVSSSNPGAAIVGAYDTLGGGFLQPLDIKLYKGGHAVLTTSSGNLLVLDVNVPEIPQLIRAYKPAGYSAYRADVASEYAWTDGDGNTQVMDVAVTSSGDGKVHTVDLTDPYNIMHYGPVRNTDGSDLICLPSDITISKTSGLVYIAGSGAVYVIDIKDPKNPKLLNVIAQTPLAPGSTVMDPLGYATALVEKDGWVYLANMQKGMRVLDLDPVTIEFWDAKLNKVLIRDELRYGDGTKEEKKYQIIFKPNGQIEVGKEEDCHVYNNYDSTLSVIDSHGTPTTAMVNGNPVLQKYRLEFKYHPTTKECNVRIKVPGQIEGLPFFILSNRDDLTLPERTVKVTPGLNGRLVQIKIPSVDGKINVSSRIIEPVGVIILAIDGLRQDVLYPKPSSSEPGVKASYDDPKGCRQNGVDTSCYVAPTQLKGFCEVLGGKIVGTTCDTANFSSKHIKLPDVTTIFPSITFAAWASIYTGKPPKDTGILGNEFFARDLITMGMGTTAAWNTTVPGLNGNPPGMVTLDPDGGAFRPELKKFGYSMLSKSLPSILNHIMPAEFAGYSYDTMAMKLAQSTPSSVLKTQQTQPLWSEVNAMVTNKYRISVPDQSGALARCSASENECRTVSFFNQYPGGADWWGTPSSLTSELWAFATTLSVAGTMDKSSAQEAIGFINNYFKKKNTAGRRKRFPALFSVYLSGLDHEAHIKGMGEYQYYFKNTLDPMIKDIVQAFKDNDEFENKIFIIVSDHGETQMPVDLIYKRKNLVVDFEGYPVLDLQGKKQYVVDELPVDMSCELKTEGFEDENVQSKERQNNSLHIWELGELMKTVGKFTRGNFSFRILSPEPIAKLFAKTEAYGARSTMAESNVIVALNGPMAHVYVTNQNELGKAAEVFRLTMQQENVLETSKWFNLTEDGYTDLRDTIEKLQLSIDQILVRVNGSYCIFDGMNDDGSAKCSPIDPLTEAYAKAWSRINDMNKTDRSGDLVLIMKNTTSGSANDRYSTAYACKAWHGSLNQGDSYVPFMVNYPSGNKYELEKMLKKDALCKSDYSNCRDNWKLPSIVKEIILRQYN